ncbi:MAG: hypothetical protein ACLQUY_20075 [Ktedonobacterales bacterium]
MTPELRATLERWLTSDNEVERRHAQHRLGQSKPLEYPSLFQQATNAAKAIGSVVASAVRSEPVSVPQEEQDRRLAICHACEFWDSRQGRCSKCGCFGQWKTWLASQRCPIGKW